MTFLLTDIEGSTGLLAELEDGYAVLLSDIRRLVRAAVEGPGGVEASARGDDVFAVFEDPAAALDAAYAIQRGMRDASWPGGRDVRLADRAAPRAPAAHGRRIRGPVGSRGGADLLRRSRRPDGPVGGGALGAARDGRRPEHRLLAVQGASRADPDLPGGGARPALRASLRSGPRNRRLDEPLRRRAVGARARGPRAAAGASARVRALARTRGPGARPRLWRRPPDGGPGRR